MSKLVINEYNRFKSIHKIDGIKFLRKAIVLFMPNQIKFH